jgi:hypothetical protein
MTAQNLSFGVKRGGLLTDPAERNDEGRRYVVGPSIELELPARFALEGSLLYSRFGSSLGTANLRVRGDSLELPVVGKYYFSRRDGEVRLFAGSGYSFRRIWFDGRRFERLTGIGDSSDLDIGVVAAGGISLRAWRLRVAPELRYTRWGGDNFPATNPNQLQVLVGITF